MIARLFAAAALLTLAACGTGNANNPAPKPTPSPTPSATPVAWLSPEPPCGGSISRAEWLVCDNKGLNDLHRRLAREWETERQYATAERLRVLELQLRALVSERNECRDAACIGTAYRRYLAYQPAPAPAPKPPVAKPKPKPKPKPRVKPRPVPKPRPGPRWDRGETGWWRDADGRSCVSQIGGAAAQRLVAQCEAATGRPGGMCSTRHSCAELRAVAEQDCANGSGRRGCRR
jgi:hypothetical protein